MELLYLSSWIESHEIAYRLTFHNSHKNKINAQNFHSFTVFIIIIIHHELGPDKPVSSLSNSLFKGLLKSSSSIWCIIQHFFGGGGILLLFMIVTRRSQFDLYLLSFSSTGSTFNYFKISSVLLW